MTEKLRQFMSDVENIKQKVVDKVKLAEEIREAAEKKGATGYVKSIEACIVAKSAATK